MGSVSAPSFRCCMFVSCVHPVAVVNAAFCMTCSLLMLVKRRLYGRGILQSRSHDYLIGSHECLLLFTPSCYCEFVVACAHKIHHIYFAMSVNVRSVYLIVNCTNLIERV